MTDETNPSRKPWVSFYTRKDGYEEWYSDRSLKVHQLVAIADGADPEKVFSNKEYVTIHKNGIPWDNRSENLEVMSSSEFGKSQHGFDSDYSAGPKYTNEECIEWIDVFVKHFGFVPSRSDISGWPGPSPTTYERYFGTWTKAIKAAGYEPRGNHE